MKRFFLLCLILSALVFAVSCGGSKKENGYDYPDEDSADADTADDSEEPAIKQGELGGECYPNKTCNDGLVCDKENNTCIKDITEQEKDDDPDKPDADSDTSAVVVDDDTTDTDDDDPTPDDDTPEVTENHKISGSYQISGNVSGIEVFLHECGKTEKIASANTDADGKYSFDADISADKVYCVNANNFYSCFAGMSDHTANISEITHVVALISTCPDFRKNETKVRKYAKLGTGKWLGELDYTKLSGIKEGLRLLSSYLDTTDSKKLSEEIADDILSTDSKFQEFFNGFKISADKKEVLINVASPDSNEVMLNVEGGSNVVAEGFKIVWTALNTTDEAAMHKFKTVEPGEYVVRAKLVAGGDPVIISEDSATLIFMLKKLTGTIDVSDMSKDISHYITSGIYAVIPKNTVIKKNGNKVDTLTYNILLSGDGSQVSKIDFGPDGTEFSGDSLYFVYELGTVFGGDPIMLAAKRTGSDGSSEVLQSAGGDPIMLAAAGDPIMFSAAGDPIMQIARSAGGDPIMYSAGGDPIMMDAGGDPIMQAAGGDPIMTNAAGDPIMSTAAGDPIMLGTSSSVMIAKTGHFSGFLLNSNSLPVSVEALLDRWCDGSYYRGYSPVEFIKKGVTDNDPESTLLPYLTCQNRKFGELGNDLYDLINKQAGFQRNLNLIENIYYISEFYNRMTTKKNSGEVAAAKNGLELRSLLASLFTATTSYNRSATLADLFDSSKIPLTYNGNIPADYSADAQKAVTGLSEVNDKYVATKKDVMIFANYVTTSQKGPDFSGVTSALTPDKFVCAWFNPDTAPQSCSKVYKLNGEGHVSIGSTEINVSDAEEIFAKFFMPMNSRLTNEEKLGLFRTYYLVLKYIGTIFYGGDTVDTLNKNLLKTAYLVFEGIDRNTNAVRITDTFDAAASTVQVFENGEMTTKPYLNRLSSLTDLISLDVATAANVEKVLINTVGFAYDKITNNTRTYYNPVGDQIENSIILTPGELPAGIKPLKDLIGSNDVDSLGNITGKMTVVVNSKISGKTYSTQKTYEFLINDLSEGIDSKPLPSDLLIRLEDASGNPIDSSKNPGIILNPGGRTFYPNEENEDGEIKIENLAPASYTIDAFADGYYGKNVGVNLPENATIGVTIKLDEEINSSSEALLTVKVGIGTLKHPDKVYIQIYDKDMELVGNEAAKFNEISNGYDDVTFDIDFGRYTLLAVGEEMYNYIEAITVGETETVKEITVVAKNACGNGIIDAGEECETGDLISTEVRCGDVFHASTNPDNKAVCNKMTCVYDKAACGAPTYSNCGDRIIDPGEGCDGGSKACSEIFGASAKGTAPCRTNCSDWETAGNCSRTYEYCGDENLPDHAIWNDGIGRFTQIYNGSSWLPVEKEAAYGTTRDECVFSCDKGYKWDDATRQCLADPLSLGNICTGQNKCFDNGSETGCPAYGKLFFGQDAQYAEVGYCTPKSFSTTGSGNQQIVVDDFTHYEWHKVASSSAKTWDEAEYECNNSTYGGKQLYWRLPSPAELLTIIDSGTGNQVFAEIFTTSGHTFWAAEDNGNSENAWRIDENGALTSVAKTTENYFICVHNEYETPAERFTAADETVTDNFSGLIWQKQYASSKSWAEALTYCEEVSTGGSFDWRLPNRNELASLIDFNGTNGFNGIPAQVFWTSTTSTGSASTGSATKAWTVGFADGSISADTKSETHYVLCVRSENNCIGSDCVDACDFEPCKNIKNSTGVCTAVGGTFTCGCKSRFHWNNSRCELDTVIHSNCDLDSLPKHGKWNIYSSIDQTCDDEDDCDWYPTLTGQYNETANPKECRFVCNPDYVWNGDDCVGKTQIVNCGSVNYLPDNTHWHYDQIVQQWVCNDAETNCHWDIGTEAKYSDDPVENRCRYKCNEHYTWDRENKICVAGTQTVNCDDETLISNASWWKDSIKQTWNGNDWVPSNTGSYSRIAVDNECRFKCNDGYFWDGEACVSPCSASSCSGVANSNGVCNATGPADYTCGCNAGYYWWDNQGCIDKKPLALGNICTITEGCYDTERQIACTEEGEDFYGQPSQYAAKGICVARNLSVNDSVENESTVFDNNTGLEWQKNVSSAFNSLETALEYCENLEYGGHSDWRLPTHYEMMTVFDYSQRDIVIKPAYTEYFYWTSTVISDEDGALVWASGHHKWFPSNYTFYEGYGDCGPNCGYTIPSDKFAFCVRGKELPAADFVVSSIEGDEIVKDKTTGLMWQKTSTVTTWKDALAYCENLDYAGFSDWRLPNTNEWASNDDIYNQTPVFEWIKGDGYWFSADTPTLVEEQTYYWSVSAPAWNASAPLAPVFILSYKTNGDYEFKVNVRCVRSGLCGEGKFWNGSECVTPCSASSCGGGAEAECVPESYDSYKCECRNAGYFWSGSTCINPCDTASCSDVPHSTHECIPTDWNTHACGCESGYFWDGTQCVPLTLGRICTGKDRCSDNSGEIVCPAEGDDFFGQDWQYARLGFCAPRSFRAETVSGDAIIIDDKLGLEWQRLHYPTSPTDINRIDWYYAVDYCNNLVYAGHDDWRLPSVKEFFSLKNNVIDLALGDGQGLWTSQESGEDSAIVIFDSYYDSYYYRNNISKDELRAVRCVRGNKIPDADLYSSTVTAGGSNFEIVTDSTTRLIWQKNPDDSKKNWKNALAYCENLEYAGLSNWRLPNNNELMSLINNDGSSNFLKISEITASDTREFWTSSSLYKVSGSAFALYSYGAGSFESKTGKYYAVCVHSNICKEGEFWNGSACVNPCDADPCGGAEHSVCVPKSYDKYTCECDNADNGYFWSGSACVNPCNANPCAVVEHCNGDCSPTGWNTHLCGCVDGYAWYGSSCHDISTPADPNYNDTYGTLELNFNESINTSGSNIENVLFNAFAIGPYGNGEAYVSNSNVASVAFYYDESGSTGVAVEQLPYYGGSSGLWVELIIPEEFATVGEHTLSVLNEDSTLSPFRIFLFDSDGFSLSCYHAFGEGTINISEIGDIANNGSLTFTGHVTLYSPKNYHGLDISYMLNSPVCDPVL